MSSWLPSIPYPPASHGYWTPMTSTINWCEEDYYATPYSAEIINSVTNLWFIYLAYQGITNCLDNGHPRIFLYAFISYLMIGIGSFIFHTTLKYPMQLLDELSMIYTACILFFATFEHGRSDRVRLVLAAMTTGIAVSVTGYYHYLGDPVFHQNMFALLTAIVFLRSVWVMEVNLRPFEKEPDAFIGRMERRRRESRNEQILRVMWKMIPIGLCSVAGGFLIWNLDNIYCNNLRSWRRRIGLPWGILLEGHGWWHLLTGIAEYYNIVWSMWLRYCLEEKQDEVEMVWLSKWASVPRLLRKEKRKM